MKKHFLLCLSLIAAMAVSADDWTLVTDASDLQEGDAIVIAYSEAGVTAGLEVGKGKSSYYLQAVESTFGNDVISSVGEGTAQLTLGGSASAWTLTNQDGKKLGVTDVKYIAWDEGTTTWTISIIGGDATISSTNENYGTLLYNTSNPRFTTYDKSSSQTKTVQIYRGKASQKHTLSYKDYPYMKSVCELPTYSAGQKVILSAGKPKKEGNVFKGWKNDEELYQPGAEFIMPDADVELVAIWEAGKETLSEDPGIKELKINGETVTAVNDVYSYELTAETPAVEVRYTLKHVYATGSPKTGFTIDVPAAGAEPATQEITVIAENGVAKKVYTVSVSVSVAAGDQGIEDVQRDDVQCTKVIRDGRLYLIYKGTMYNVQGQRVW